MVQTESKAIDNIAMEEMKKTVQRRDELSKHIFKVAYKSAYRRFTGNSTKYLCSTKCNNETCTCEVPGV